MRKSRVEKNKELYEELDSIIEVNHGLDLDAFELEDLSDASTEVNETEFVLEDISEKEEPIVETIEIKEEQIVEVKEKKEEIPLLTNEEYVIEQPVSYNKMLIAEEVLREKLEKQKELKDSKRGLKRSPVTESYSAERMQKNIKQHEGVDVRKELNIKIKKSNGRVITALVMLLITIVGAGIALSYVILNR